MNASNNQPAPPTASCIHNMVRADRVHSNLYTSQEIFDAEMERIFERGWVWLAHESEVANPGDFKTTQLGRAPVIVCRDKHDQIHVLLNRCRHRAATVCEQQHGNAKRFICPYHAWNYGLDGRLRGVPFADGYGRTLDKSQLSLARATVGRYQGLIFASLNPEVEPLDSFLGPAKRWIDHFMTQGAGWPMQVAGQLRFSFRGNWKIQLENTTDFYHLPFIHRSFLDAVDEQTAKAIARIPEQDTLQVYALGNGHAVSVFNPGKIDLTADCDGHIPPHLSSLAAELGRDHPPEEVRRIIRAIDGVGFNLNIFPNLGLSGSFIRELRPLAVDRTEIRHIALTMKGGPAAANRARLRIFEKFQGPAGFGTPDDMEAWERVQRGVHAGRDMWIMLHRGLCRERVDEKTGRSSQVSDETGMREAYAMWKRMMSV